MNRLLLLLTTRGQCRHIHTDAVFPVPVQLESWRTGTLVAAQRVDAGVLAAPAVYTALVNICGNMNFMILLVITRAVFHLASIAFSEGGLEWVEEEKKYLKLVVEQKKNCSDEEDLRGTRRRAALNLAFR